METSANDSSHDWSALLDDLKQKEGIVSDAKLAAELGVTRGYICSVRKGRKGLSIKLAQDVFSRLGRAFDAETLERLLVPVRIRTFTRKLTNLRHDVIARANGHCQLCGCAAPFKDKDGRPYLEVHHVTPIGALGAESPANLVALCPNCHRKIQISADSADREKLQKIAAKYASLD